MTRIVSGVAGGRRLKVPPSGVRPTGDRAREGLFNSLATLLDLEGAAVLDLYAGSGALGLEALSRGAAWTSFVEDGAKAQALIRNNVAKARAADATTLLRQDATRLGANREAAYGLVFLDPPYAQGLGERAIASALAGGWVAPGAVVVWEESRPPLVPRPLIPIDQRRYGDTVVTLARMPGA